MAVKKPNVNDNGQNELKKLSSDITNKGNAANTDTSNNVLGADSGALGGGGDASGSTDSNALGGTDNNVLGADSGALGSDSSGGALGGNGLNNETNDANANETLNLTELGRVYTLKRIYSIMKSLNDYVDDAITKYSKDQNLVKIKTQIVNMQDLFVLLSSNIEKYTDKLEKIIATYNEYIVTVSKLLSEKYSLDDDNKKNEEEDIVLNDTNSTNENKMNVEQKFKTGLNK